MKDQIAMTIHELLARFTPEEIVFQRLDESLLNVRSKGQGSSVVSFGTNQMQPADALDQRGRKFGLVLWVDRNRWLEECEKIRSMAPPESPEEVER